MGLGECGVTFDEMPWPGTFGPGKRWELEAATTSPEWCEA